jgi:alpha-mannosidase
MKNSIPLVVFMGWVLAAALPGLTAIAEAADSAGASLTFSRLVPTPKPKIVAVSEEFPWDNLKVDKLLDGDPKTEFASNGQGTNTFVEFDFGAPVRLAGFRHQDRNAPATTAASELEFRDTAGQMLAKAQVRHVNGRSGVTFFALREPVTAQRVRWRITKLGSPHATVGAAEVCFFSPGEPEAAPQAMTLDAKAIEVVGRDGRQPLRVTLDYPYAQTLEATVRVEGQEPRPLKLAFGNHTLNYSIPVVEAARPLRLAVECAGRTLKESSVTLRPARHTTIYILPHSHTDIGYTEIQTEIEDKQVNNLLLGMKYARETATNPPGSRFVWNVEVLWAADLFLHRLGPTERAAFFEAVKKGQVALCGMYLNELTGLCRPEELVRLFQFATELREKTGQPLDTAMISDVPGYIWGTVPAMAQAGLRYFSAAPNYFDRIGDILVQWENKPFWWIGPDGESKVLVWIPYRGYAMSHIYHALTPEFVEHYQEQLRATDYPYEIAYMRWAGHGDNATPDPVICDFVKGWSAKHEWPKFIIASASEAFRAFEKRYGDKLPQVRGDWTPYWEDGAGSSALETGLNRASSDRLAQAEALWAMQGPAGYPVTDFREAWRNVLLYSEHTWGAWCSINEPSRRETREQWTVKQSYAVAADRQSRELLSRALTRAQQGPDESSFDVFNTTSWMRTGPIMVPKYLSEKWERILDSGGAAVPVQRLTSGELFFIATDVPPLAAKRYTGIEPQKGPASPAEPAVPMPVRASGGVLENGRLLVRLDEKTGAIAELKAAGVAENLVDAESGQGINDYLYLVGNDVAALQRNGPVKLRVVETGPLVASIIAESDAPGCHLLAREIRLMAGADSVELINTVDKKRIDARSYRDNETKESVNFAFPFLVPDGEVRYDILYGVARPDADQIPSACKNWLTVGRWADVANTEHGVTWVTLDAPLMQVGGITATLLNSQTNPDVWRKKIGRTQKLYSWAMNNHWGTNYRAYQEGPTVFRFILRPHRGPTEPAGATRFATEFSQPLLVTGTRGRQPLAAPLVRVAPADVIITGLKPSGDGRAVILRLYNASASEEALTLDWGTRKPRSVRLTDTSERAGERLPAAMTLPAYGLVALRAEW